MLYIMKDYVLLGRSNTMERKKVWAVYFSATDTTKKTVLTIADEAARLFGAEREDYDFTLPGMRESGFAAGKDDLVIFGNAGLCRARSQCTVKIPGHHSGKRRSCGSGGAFWK